MLVQVVAVSHDSACVMPSDYVAISAEHDLDYGRKLDSWAKELLANRYTERTHFIYELLQNAEDAVRKRVGDHLPTSVTFTLRADGLEVRHSGRPFTPADVKSICAINESTKKDDLTEIGRFGIGFKSVYAFSDRPEVHSGDEHFAIEKFVRPVGVPARPAKTGETFFWIPFRDHDKKAAAEIAKALRSLGARALLFLTAITEVAWSLPDGTNGVFLRNRPVPADSGEFVTLLGETSNGPTAEEQWVLFRRAVERPGGAAAGSVALAFAVALKPDGTKQIQEVQNSKLVVFFPTDVLTGTGFLIQGPYRTTPSRDNVPANDEWNQKLVQETAELLISALGSLRDKGLLDVAALNTLPLDPRPFGTETKFHPLFAQTVEALKQQKLLPTSAGSHVSGTVARLARSDAVRELLSPRQLAQLLGTKPDLFWLSEGITQNKTALLREYLVTSVGVSEVTNDTLESRLSTAF